MTKPVTKAIFWSMILNFSMLLLFWIFVVPAPQSPNKVVVEIEASEEIIALQKDIMRLEIATTRNWMFILGQRDWQQTINESTEVTLTDQDRKLLMEYLENERAKTHQREALRTGGDRTE